MTYIVSDLISDIKTRAKDLTLSDSLVLSFLQATQDEVLNRSRFPFQEVVQTPVTLAISDTDYSLPAAVDVISYLSLKDTTVDSSFEPEYLPLVKFYDTYERPEDRSQGLPESYTMFGSKIFWSGPLDKAYELKLRYIKKSTVLTTSSAPDIPEQYKEIYIRGALAGIEEYRENFDIAALHRRKVEELAEDMLDRTYSRQVQTPHKARFGGR